MGILIVGIAVLAIALMIVISGRRSVAKMKLLLRQEQEKTIKLHNKIDSSREEFRKNKEELERGRDALRRERELNKKKLRKASSAQSDHHLKENEGAMTNKAIDDSKKAVSAMESQIEQLRGEKIKSEETIRSELAKEFKEKQSKNEELTAELKKKLANLKDELKKQKNLLRPEGHKIDLKSLPDEAASEFARVYRKAEQHERLHGIARAKLHLAQEKFGELQKRYFAVCRELAVAAGKNENIEQAEARNTAESIVSGEQNGHSKEESVEANKTQAPTLDTPENKEKKAEL